MSVLTDIQAATLVAKRFEDKGYAVTLEPEPSMIPFDLAGYRPDLLAEKEHDNVIVEVKRRSSKVNADLFMRIAQRARAHGGWSFQLVTVSDEEMEDEASQIALLSAGQISSVLARLDELMVQPSMASFALPLLWSAYVGALETLLRQSPEKTRYRGDLSVLNRAYTLGMISIENLTEARRLLQLRNQVVHSSYLNVEADDIKMLRSWVEGLLPQIQALERGGAAL
jgi:hypothetical protein